MHALPMSSYLHELSYFMCSHVCIRIHNVFVLFRQTIVSHVSMLAKVVLRLYLPQLHNIIWYETIVLTRRMRSVVHINCCESPMHRLTLTFVSTDIVAFDPAFPYLHYVSIDAR
jgi:hypothetical protein